MDKSKYEEYQDMKIISDERLLKVGKRSNSSPSLITLTFKDKYGNILKGTATIASPNLILTSSHNIFSY